MSKIIIETPEGRVAQNKGRTRAFLVWNPGFGSKWSETYNNAQEYLDKEVVEGNKPFMPFLTGALILSGKLGTRVGSGLVRWIVPYARYQYYRPTQAPKYAGTLRGPFWFERWKALRGRSVVLKTRKIAGGG